MVRLVPLFIKIFKHWNVTAEELETDFKSLHLTIKLKAITPQ
jgi:hypothetical protein